MCPIAGAQSQPRGARARDRVLRVRAARADPQAVRREDVYDAIRLREYPRRCGGRRGRERTAAWCTRRFLFARLYRIQSMRCKIRPPAKTIRRNLAPDLRDRT